MQPKYYTPSCLPRHAAHSSGVSGFSNFRHRGARGAFDALGSARRGPGANVIFHPTPPPCVITHLHLRPRSLSMPMCGLIVESLISGDNYTAHSVGWLVGARSLDTKCELAVLCFHSSAFPQQGADAADIEPPRDRCGEIRATSNISLDTFGFRILFLSRERRPSPSIEFDPARIALPGRDPARSRMGGNPQSRKGEPESSFTHCALD